MTDRVRRLSAHLAIQAYQPTDLVLQLAVSSMAGTEVKETWTVTDDSGPVTLTEVGMTNAGRVHTHVLQPGRFVLDYEAVVTGDADEPEVTEADRISYLRPSRYAESDRLGAVARSEFHGLTGATEILAAVSSWVGSQLAYVSGSSQPTDGAVDTLLQRQGVCRDYAHLVIALLRAMDIPARLAAVYAPGLNPMDFHAVAEALVDGHWRVVDATLLAPRASLVRIATGRDAADTAFMSTYGGGVDLNELWVSAIIDGNLPGEDVTELISIS